MEVKYKAEDRVSTIMLGWPKERTFMHCVNTDTVRETRACQN